MNLETKITIYKFTPQVFTLTRKSRRVYLQYRLFPSKCLLLSVAEVSQGTTSVQAGGNFRAGVEHVSFRPQTKVVAL